jgi:hypothetical protein
MIGKEKRIIPIVNVHLLSRQDNIIAKDLQCISVSLLAQFRRRAIVTFSSRQKRASTANLGSPTTYRMGETIGGERDGIGVSWSCPLRYSATRPSVTKLSVCVNVHGLTFESCAPKKVTSRWFFSSKICPRATPKEQVMARVDSGPCKVKNGIGISGVTNDH